MPEINMEHYFEITAKLIEYFPDHMFRSEWESDYCGDGGKHFIYVLTDLSADEAYNRLRRFDDEWWLENSRRFDIAVTLEMLS